MKKLQRGYTLAEMLVVVAIVGIFSLIAVPQFITFYRQSQVRGSVRSFNAYIRGARAQAIKDTRPYGVAIATVPGSVAGQSRGRYRLMVGTIANDGSISWEQQGRDKFLEETVYFANSDLEFNGGDGIYFLSNGTTGNMPADGDPTIVVKTDVDVPNNNCTLTFTTVGSFRQTSTTVH